MTFNFCNYLNKKLIFYNYEGITKKETILFLTKKLCQYYNLDYQRVLGNILAREESLSSGIGGGIAVPHCRLMKINTVMVSVMVSKVPIDFDALDGKPVQLIFLFASPLDNSELYFQFLHFVTGFGNKELYEKVLKSSSPSEFLEIWSDVCKQ